MEKIVLGGGCFWCLEAAYHMIPGVHSVVSGYSGGQYPNPSYEEVCSGRSGHAEVVEIEFNPSAIRLEKILYIFWKIHDPTTLNRQGADVGTQYRSCIFYLNDKQKKAIETQIKNLEESKVYQNPIVTQVNPLKVFYPTESYHQNYYKNHPEQGYCQLVIAPKLASLSQDLLK